MLYGIKYKKLIKDEILYQRDYEVPFQQIKSNIDLIDQNRFTTLFLDKMAYQYRSRGAKALLEVDIPILDGMNEIPDSLFSSIDIESIEIPNWIKNIDVDAFRYSDLKTLTFQEGSQLRILGRRSFEETSLQKVVLPYSLYHLDSHCFDDCFDLHTVELNQNLQSIGDGCFKGCKLLSKLIFHGAKEVFEEIDLDDEWLYGSKINKIVCDDGEILI